MVLWRLNVLVVQSMVVAVSDEAQMVLEDVCLFRVLVAVYEAKGKPVGELVSRYPITAGRCGYGNSVSQSSVFQSDVQG
jgi:hypothetical protein